MKTKCLTLLTGIFFAATALASAATNDLSSALQRGLFEEEANHNLDAAIKSYQSIATQFDKDRKLAATAIFRLGEVYRKQGKTNEASAQYERILKEFSDQQTLADLSRSNLPKTEVSGGNIPPALHTIHLPNEEDKEIERIKALLKDSPDLINASGQNGIPLHYAVQNNLTRVAEFLLANGADVNRKSNNKTPLHLAVENGDKSMVEFLIAHGADLEAKDGTGATALHIAAQRGFKTIAEILLKNKANVQARNSQPNGGKTPLHMAAQAGHKAVAELLLANGADVNVKDNFNSTPLISAVLSKNLEMTKFLIDRKADLNAINKEGYAALHYAVRDGQSPLVQLLLQNGANPELKIPKHQSVTGGALFYEMTPLHLAALSGQKEIVEILLAAKANPNSKNREGRTPLHFAVSGSFVEIAKLLLANGAEIDSPDNDGATPLRWSLGSDKSIVEFLLGNKANPNAQDKNGETPLGVAKKSNSPTGEMLVELLMKFGANENAQRLTRISVSRKSRNFLQPIFFKGTNSWNRFSLLEAFAQFYSVSGNADQNIIFPDLTKVEIHRLNSKTSAEEKIPLNLEEILKSGDCAKDIWLQWGDLIEIPETDHKLGGSWLGFPKEILEMLPKCLSRKVFISVKGETKPVSLEPKSRVVPGQPVEQQKWWLVGALDFWLKNV
ncbi:MAG: ankyrin repeat domain-containing protein, partial [Verrucomicrobiota bacterium]|nr:ankyrin repeat domain-containing protein [Verrucomicrobiota bacterium]